MDMANQLYSQRGPLNSYRRKATFDVAALRDLVDGEEVVKFRNQVWDTMAKDPLFATPVPEELSIEQQRQLTVKRVYRLFEYDFPSKESHLKRLGFLQALQAFDFGLAMLHGLHEGVSKYPLGGWG